MNGINIKRTFRYYSDVATAVPYIGRSFLTLIVNEYNEPKSEWDYPVCLLAIHDLLDWFRSSETGLIPQNPNYPDTAVDLPWRNQILTLQGDWTLGVLYLDACKSSDDGPLEDAKKKMLQFGLIHASDV